MSFENLHVDKQAKTHDACLQFPVDFDTKRTQYIHLGRIMFGDFCGRLILTPKGLKLYITKTAVDEGFIVLGEPFEDQIEYAGLGDKK